MVVVVAVVVVVVVVRVWPLHAGIIIMFTFLVTITNFSKDY